MHEHLYVIAEALYVKYNGNREQAKQWLSSPIQQFNGYTPYQLINSGLSHYVIYALIPSIQE